MDAKRKLTHLCDSITLLLAGVALLLPTATAQAAPDNFAGNFTIQPRATGLPIAPVRIVINIFDPEEWRNSKQRRWNPPGLDPGGMDWSGGIPASAAQDGGLAFSLAREGISLSIEGPQTPPVQDQGSPLSPSFTKMLNSPSSPDGLALEFSRMRFKGLNYTKGNVRIVMTGRLKRLLEFHWQVE